MHKNNLLINIYFLFYLIIYNKKKIIKKTNILQFLNIQSISLLFFLFGFLVKYIKYILFI